jgi:hypothetical protein
MSIRGDHVKERKTGMGGRRFVMVRNVDGNMKFVESRASRDIHGN